MRHDAMLDAGQLRAGSDDSATSDGLGQRQLLREVLRLRQQLARVAQSAAVAQAYRLTVQVAQVLEPVWSIAGPDPGVAGVGYLRRFGAADLSGDAAGSNAGVAAKAASVFGSIDLVAPSVGEVWRSLSRPAEALWDSVQGSGCAVHPGSAPARPTVTATVRPALSHFRFCLTSGLRREALLV